MKIPIGAVGLVFVIFIVANTDSGLISVVIFGIPFTILIVLFMLGFHIFSDPESKVD